MTDSKLVRGRWIVTGGEERNPVLHDAALAIAGNTIEEIGDWQDLRHRYPEAVVLGSQDMAVMPGLINAHHHSQGVTTAQHGTNAA